MGSLHTQLTQVRLRPLIQRQLPTELCHPVAMRLHRQKRSSNSTIRIIVRATQVKEDGMNHGERARSFGVRATCRRFPAGRPVAKPGRIQRPVFGEGGAVCQFDGDKSPAESGDRSPRSKMLREWADVVPRAGVLDCAGKSDATALSDVGNVRVQENVRTKAVSRPTCHRSPKRFANDYAIERTPITLM